MRHASLFTGIGGFDLAAQWMGWENVFQVEIDGFCQKVLEKNFPNVKRYGDIKQFNGTEWAGKIDVLTGGFPCQPFSLAGRRKGTEDNRYLWPEMLRIIGEIQPTYIVAENVPGIYSQKSGMVFEKVCAQMEAEGYEVQPVNLPACGKEAPHIRERFWFVAHFNGSRLKRNKVTKENNNGWPAKRMVKGCKPYSIHRNSSAANFNESGLSVGIQSRECSFENQASTFQRGKSSRIYSKTDWREFPTQSPILRGVHGIPNRVDRIKSLGNAIVPQVAFEIFKAISSTMK